MSVVNRMLRDLDARAAGAAASPPAPPPTPAGIPDAPRWAPRRDNPRWRMTLILLAGGSAIAAAALADLSPFAARTHLPGPAIADTTAAAPPEPAADLPALPEAAAVAAPATAPAPRAPRQDTPAPAAALPALDTVATAPAAAVAPPLITKRSVAPSADALAADALREAVALARAGQRQAALQRALEALTLAPEQGAARQLAAVLQHESGDTASALALLREGARLSAPPPAMTLLLARLLSTQGLADEALQVLQQHALGGADAEGLRGALLAQQGRYDAALTAYESAVRQQPGQAMWWFGLAVALESQGQPERARAAYTQARGLGLPREDLLTYTEQRLRALN